MTGEFRTPHNSEYVAAIGRAIFIFANYEKTVVYTMEKLRHGFVNKWRFAKKPMTAETIGKKFKNAVGESRDLIRPFASNLKGVAWVSLFIHRHCHSPVPAAP